MFQRLILSMAEVHLKEIEEGQVMERESGRRKENVIIVTNLATSDVNVDDSRRIKRNGIMPTTKTQNIWKVSGPADRIQNPHGGGPSNGCQSQDTAALETQQIKGLLTALQNMQH